MSRLPAMPIRRSQLAARYGHGTGAGGALAADIAKARVRIMVVYRKQLPVTLLPVQLLHSQRVKATVGQRRAQDEHFIILPTAKDGMCGWSRLCFIDKRAAKSYNYAVRTRYTGHEGESTPESVPARERAPWLKAPLRTIGRRPSRSRAGEPNPWFCCCSSRRVTGVNRPKGERPFGAFLTRVEPRRIRP